MVRKKFCLGEIGVTSSKQIRLSVCGQTVGESHRTRRCLLTASIYSVNSQYPCAAMNFSVATSTRSHNSSSHQWCRRKSTLCHLLENFDTVHVLAKAFLGSPDQCREYSLSTIYYTEFHHAPLPTPTQLHLSIFSTVVRLLNSPVHSLESAISKHLCRVWPLNHKKLPCAGPGQELSVNIAVPPLPKLPLHKLHLCAIRRN